MKPDYLCRLDRDWTLPPDPAPRYAYARPGRLCSALVGAGLAWAVLILLLCELP
jgi:hypothetical protein